MRQSYKAFLTTLAESKTEQTYDSLQWAGEGLITLGAYAEAEKVLRRVLTEFTQDPQFLQQASGRGRLLRTKLKLAAALRGQRESLTKRTRFSRSSCAEQPYIETLFEKGLLLEAEAEAGHGNWSAAVQPLGGARQEVGSGSTPSERLLRRLVPRGLVSLKQKEPTKARQTLMGIMRLSPVGRRSRDEGEISSVDCEAQVKNKDTKMACRFRGLVRPPFRRYLRLAVMASADCRCSGDDVNLIPGTTFKQAIGGRVKGQVQSESPSEVVVLLGRHDDERADGPDPVDPLRRPVGEFSTGRSPGIERSIGRGGRAVQEGGGRIGR